MTRADDYLDARRSYLFPAIRIPGYTCEVCRGTKKEQYPTCGNCEFAIRQSNPENLGFGMFVRAGEQTSANMHRYKGSDNSAGRLNVEALLLLGIRESIRMPSIEFDVITTIPSFSGRPGIHPLYQLTQQAAGKLGVGEKVFPVLSVIPGIGKQRSIRHNVFAVDESKVSGQSILLIDDTWTTGSSMRSAVLALREAGAVEVNAIALARWIQAGNERGENDLWRLAEERRPSFSEYSFYSGY